MLPLEGIVDHHCLYVCHISQSGNLTHSDFFVIPRDSRKAGNCYNPLLQFSARFSSEMRDSKVFICQRFSLLLAPCNKSKTYRGIGKGQINFNFLILLKWHGSWLPNVYNFISWRQPISKKSYYRVGFLHWKRSENLALFIINLKANCWSFIFL